MEALTHTVSDMQLLQVKDIECDAYQRRLSYAECKRMKDEYDPNLVGVLLVAKRNDGKYAVIDGHHRLIMMRMLGIKTALCQVATGLTYQEEADLFGKFNKQRRCASPTDLLNSNVEAGRRDAIDVVRIAKKAGYYCGKTNNRKKGKVQISAVRALTSSYDMLHAEGLYTMLDVISSTWIKNKDAVGASMLNGTTTFFSLYGDKIKKETFVKALSRTSPQNIIARARLSGETNLRYPVAKVIWNSYNKSCRGSNRLPYLF